MKKNDATKYGVMIKKARKIRRMTQQQLADSVGCSREIIARYEIEEYTGAFETVRAICKTLNVSADWLLCLTREKNA